MFSKKFKKLKNPSSWRRLSIANWDAANDPTVYGVLEYDFTKGLEFIKKVNETQNIKISPTHFVAKAMALTLARYPDINGIIRFGQIYLRDTVDMFLQVAVPGQDSTEKPDLSGALIRECDKKSFKQISEELKTKSELIRSKNDPEFKDTIKLMDLVPPIFLKPLLKLLTFILYDIGMPIPAIGLKEDPFGSAMVTSVGMWNVPPGFPPIVPISRVPLLACVGAVAKKPWVVDDKIEIRPILQINVTFDHRFIDGFTGSRMIHFINEIFEKPEEYLESDK
ncbi:2-oxo acid dehydrogenase subunit E2 [bacterium]|nr:2-oxo acid dehydrogenase subunit E2 [bacterium]